MTLMVTGLPMIFGSVITMLQSPLAEVAEADPPSVLSTLVAPLIVSAVPCTPVTVSAVGGVGEAGSVAVTEINCDPLSGSLTTEVTKFCRVLSRVTNGKSSVLPVVRSVTVRLNAYGSPAGAAFKFSP